MIFDVGLITEIIQTKYMINYPKELIHYIALFDWDGTIVASVKEKAKVLMNCLNDYNIDEKILMKSIMKRTGVKRDIKIKEILLECSEYNINDNELNTILINYSKQLTDICNINPIPGFKDFIECRKSMSYICSSAPRIEIISGLAKINVPHELFTIFDKVAFKVEIFRQIKERSSFPIISFGDSFTDYNAAISNDINFIGVCYDNEELSEMKNIRIINSYNDLVIRNESAQQSHAAGAEERR